MQDLTLASKTALTMDRSADREWRGRDDSLVCALTSSANQAGVSCAAPEILLHFPQ